MKQLTLYDGRKAFEDLKVNNYLDIVLFDYSDDIVYSLFFNWLAKQPKSSLKI